MIRMTCVATPYVRCVGDPVTPTKRAFGAHGGRKRNLSGTQLVDPTRTTVAGSPVRTGRYRSVGVVAVPLKPGPRLADGEGGGATGLGDPVVLAGRIALDLELDPGVRAELEALLVRNVLVDAIEAGLAGHVAAAGQAVELAVLLAPGRRKSGVNDVGGERDS